MRGRGTLPRAGLLALLAGVGWLRAPGAAADDPPPVGGKPSAPPPGEDSDGTPVPLLAGIQRASAAGIAWLKSRQRADGTWGDLHSDNPNYNGKKEGYDTPFGPTALALYTLLKCDVPLSDPVVKKGFEFLKRTLRPRMDAYEVSMILLAVTATADPFKRSADSKAAGERVKLTGEWRKWATDMKDRLVAMRAPLGWRYWGKDDSTAGGRQDLSSTQLAALALFAAERCGLSVDPSVWTGIVQFALEQQEETGPDHPRAVSPHKPAKSGASAGETESPSAASPQDHARGFAYIRGVENPREGAASGGMTACGVGVEMLARFVLTTRFPQAWPGLDAGQVQQSVYDGLSWLDLHWSPFENPVEGGSHYHVYYLYCVERAMDLVGVQLLGEHLWYVEMAEQLVARQNTRGWWDSKSTLANGEVLDTCFALLFLHRATRGGIPFPSVTGGSEEKPVDGR